MNELYKKTARNFPDERTIWTELRSRFIRASAVHTIGLHAPSLIPRPKPRNQGNEGQPGCTHRKSTHTLGNGDTTQQPARNSEGELAAAAAAPPPPPPPPLLLLLLLLCCCCAAAVLLLCCYCAAAASPPAMHRGAQPVSTGCFSFCVLWNARRSE